MATVNTILILAANPTKDLNLARETTAIDNAIRRKERTHTWAVQQLHLPTFKEIKQNILDRKPKILHFCGHGTTEGLCIASSDTNSESVELSSTDLEALLSLFSRHIHCVILNACWSSKQAEILAKHIPFVIGMCEPISDGKAIAFASDFYDAITNGESYEIAFKYACTGSQLPQQIEAATSVLRFEELQTPILFRKADIIANSDASVHSDVAPATNSVAIAPIRRYTCDRDVPTIRFRTAWTQHKATNTPVFYIIPSQQQANEISFIRRLVFNEIRDETISRYFEDIGALRLRHISCHKEYCHTDFQTAISAGFNENLSPQVESLQEFVSKLHCYPGLQSLGLLPFPLSFDLVRVGWLTELENALKWLFEEFCALRSPVERHLVFFLVIRTAPEHWDAAKERVKQLTEAHKHIHVLPPLGVVTKDDIINWANPIFDSDRERDTLVAQVLSQLGESCTPDGWHMEKVERTIDKIITERNNAAIGM